MFGWYVFILFIILLIYFLQNESNEQDQDYSAVMNDPEFLQHLVSSLPGVNPNSEAIRNALGALTQQSQDNSEEAKKEEKKEDKK